MSQTARRKEPSRKSHHFNDTLHFNININYINIIILLTYINIILISKYNLISSLSLCTKKDIFIS